MSMTPFIRVRQQGKEIIINTHRIIAIEADVEGVICIELPGEVCYETDHTIDELARALHAIEIPRRKDEPKP